MQAFVISCILLLSFVILGLDGRERKGKNYKICSKSRERKELFRRIKKYFFIGFEGLSFSEKIATSRQKF